MLSCCMGRMRRRKVAVEVENWAVSQVCSWKDQLPHYSGTSKAGSMMGCCWMNRQPVSMLEGPSSRQTYEESK